MRQHAIFVAVLLSSFTASAFAQGDVPAGASIYIEKMEHDLDGYLRAEIVKQKIPLKVVLKADDADLILTGSSTKEEKRSWHEGWLTAEKDKATGSVMVVDKRTNAMIWAGEAGDRSLWWGALKKGGKRKVAERLVNEMKDDLFKDRF